MTGEGGSVIACGSSNDAGTFLLSAQLEEGIASTAFFE